MLLKREYSYPELEGQEITTFNDIMQYDIDKIEYEQNKEAASEYSKKLNEDKNVFIQKISEIDDFKTNLPEIKKLLDEDNRLLKNQMWQYN